MYFSPVLQLTVITILAWASCAPTNLAFNKKVTVSNITTGSDQTLSVSVNEDISASYSSISSKITCVGCLIIAEDDNQWWMVDLGDTYFITSITIYTGEASYVLQNVEVLSTANDSLSDIAKSHAEWDSLLFISKQTAEVTELVQPARAAQFVAIFALREGSIFLAEVEIYGYALGDFQPTELQFTDVDSSSIMLGWEPPDNNDTIQVEYQFACDDEDTWTKTDEGLTATHQGLSVSEFKDGVNCRVRVETYSETVASAFLQCSDEIKPTQLEHSLPVIELINGRLQWMYRITWSPPSNYKCMEDVIPYKLEVYENGNLAEIYLKKSSFTLHVDGGVSVQVQVLLQSRNGVLSQPITLPFTTSTDIAPQISPTDVEVTAIDQNCVRVSWGPVEYPNGPKSGLVYQVNCQNANAWVTATSPYDSCGHNPYEEVSCSVRAHRGSNAAGNQNSREGQNSNWTSCGKPSPPEFEVTAYFTEEFSAALDITWQVPGAFCEKIVSYSVTVLTGNTKILDRVYDTNAEKMVTVDAEGFTRYSVKMTATNNANIVSDEREKLVSTPKTECSEPPEIQNTNLTAVSHKYRINSSVTYICVDGYVPQNPQNLLCTWSNNNTEWSGSITCRSQQVNEARSTVSSEVTGNRPAVIGGAVSGAVVVVIAAAIIAVFMVRKRRQSNKETPIESTETESSAETHKAPVAAGDSDQDRIYDTPCATDVIYENRRTYENWQAQEANETQSCVVPQYCNTGAYNSVADGGYTSPSFSNAAHFYGSQSTLTGTADDSTDHISSRPADLELAQMRANLRPVNTQLQ